MIFVNEVFAVATLDHRVHNEQGSAQDELDPMGVQQIEQLIDWSGRMADGTDRIEA
ncbi:MAG: hypothetical protein HP498_06070 [Nitrospira sp.]|nr:hypothetical protein [Nitrospira sp.]